MRPPRWPATSSSATSWSSTTTTRSPSRTTPQIAFTEDVAARYEAYGWHVQTVDWTHGGDGYDEDVQALWDAVQAAKSVTDRPSFINLRTIIAWPAPNAQNTGKAHGSALGADEVAATKEILGFDPEQSFEVASEVLDHTRGLVRRGTDEQRAWQESFESVGGDEPRAQGAPGPARHPHPARGLGGVTALVRGRRQGRGHPQGLR